MEPKKFILPQWRRTFPAPNLAQLEELDVCIFMGICALAPKIGILAVDGYGRNPSTEDSARLALYEAHLIPGVLMGTYFSAA